MASIFNIVHLTFNLSTIKQLNCSQRAAYIEQWLASSPGSSQFFNATRRKTGEPGRRNHVSAIVQPLCTVKHRTVPEPYKQPNFTVWWSLLKVCGSNWIDYKRLQLLKAFKSIAVSIYLFPPFRSIIQSEVSAHDQHYFEYLDVKCTRIVARWATISPHLPSKYSLYGSGTVLCFLYKAITKSRSRDFASQALPFFCTYIALKNWEEPGDKAKQWPQQCLQCYILVVVCKSACGVYMY